MDLENLKDFKNKLTKINSNLLNVTYKSSIIKECELVFSNAEFLNYLDKNEQYQLNTSCEKLSNMVHKSWFELPPLMEFYYKKRNPFYRTLPSFRNDCLNENKAKMEFISPKKNEIFYLAKDFTKTEKVKI